MRPLEFVACSQLPQILGLRAHDERELAEILTEVPAECVHYHTHGHFLRHGFVGAPYPNDFATWAAIQVRDRVLGERLAAVSPLDFGDMEGMREELVSIIDDHLASLPIVPRVVFGEPFDFMQSRLVEVSLGRAAHDLRELRDALVTLPLSAIYFHLVEARVRGKEHGGDLIGWVRRDLARPDLAAPMARIDSHLIGLERLRKEMLGLCEEALRAEGSGDSPVA